MAPMRVTGKRSSGASRSMRAPSGRMNPPQRKERSRRAPAFIIQPMRYFGILLLAGALAGCSKKPSSDFAKLSNEATYKILSFSPVNASAQGLHKLGTEDFDTQLDDLRNQNLRRQREYF